MACSISNAVPQPRIKPSMIAAVMTNYDQVDLSTLRDTYTYAACSWAEASTTFLRGTPNFPQSYRHYDNRPGPYNQIFAASR